MHLITERRRENDSLHRSQDSVEYVVRVVPLRRKEGGESLVGFTSQTTSGSENKWRKSGQFLYVSYCMMNCLQFLVS